MSTKNVAATKPTTIATGSNPNPSAPLTLVGDAGIPNGPVTPPTGENITTPEHALAQLEATITKLGGMWAKGGKAFACRTAGQRLANALAEVQALEAHAKELRDGMAGLVTEAIAAINGTGAPKKATPVATVGTSDKPAV